MPFVTFTVRRGLSAADKARLSQQFVDRFAAALLDRRVIACQQVGVGIEQPAAVGDKQMAPERTLDQMQKRRPRRRHAHIAAGDGDVHAFFSVSSAASRPPI